MQSLISIDGSLGTGGGQVIRTALALSMALGIPFHMENIRAQRPNPGLRPQHLACVRAAGQLCGAKVRGDSLNSQEIFFHPGEVVGGEYRFDIGTGGSVSLLLQAVIPPMMIAKAPSTITVSGGTHVPFAPPFEFLRDCLFPRLEAMGPKLKACLERAGYMAEGGGSVAITVEPVSRLRSLNLDEQGAHTDTKAIIYMHGQPDAVLRQERRILLSKKFAELELKEADIAQARETTTPTQGSGNAVIVTTSHGSAPAMVFGEYLQRNRMPQKVADIAARHALDYVRSGCATDYHLADQLLVPLALAGGGSMTVNKITEHIVTCLQTIGRFMDCRATLPPVGTRNAQVVFTTAIREEETGDTERGLPAITARDTPAPWRQWGRNLVEEGAVTQMRHACSLPVAVRGALMPDAHKGYGLPIGGVLAVKNAVIPYAVGVDIACRMRLTVLDMPVTMFGKAERNALRQALKTETRFGRGAMFAANERRDHPVMDEDWGFASVLRQNRKKAWKQLGTSGKGNHFVEFGELHLDEAAVLGGKRLEEGSYLALLSHSGSRGTGEAVAMYYSNLARQRCPGLPRGLEHLAWLDLESDAGQEYWAAMQLMGRYAAASHELIHRHILRHLGANALAQVENHHNFAWKEQVDGQEAIVHRKGATPAALGVEGVIPGSMGAPAYVVRGRGNQDALNSCAHGAGRCMSRSAAFQSLDPDEVRHMLNDHGVELLSGQLDEAPRVYKDIDAVMAAQGELVDILARFVPRMVRMAPVEGDRAKRKAEAIDTWR